MAPYARLDPSTLPVIAARLRALRIAMVGEGPRATADFARETGLPRANWSLWESRNSQRIGLDSAIQVAEKWKVTLDWIYRGKTHGLDPSLKRRLTLAAKRV